VGFIKRKHERGVQQGGQQCENMYGEKKSFRKVELGRQRVPRKTRTVSASVIEKKNTQETQCSVVQRPSVL